MTDAAAPQTPPRLVYFGLTAGEAKTLNTVFGTGKWEPGVEYQWTSRDRRTLTEKMDELRAKARWPGTKKFDPGAAYHAELLGRIASRLPV